MKKFKSAFTMIELIFTIVIIGILASIAIPSLTTTRDDAKISRLSHQIQTIKTEIATSIFAKGKIPKTKEEVRRVSNTVIDLEENGDLIIDDGYTDRIKIYLIDSSTREHCKKMVLDYNDSSKIELYIESEHRGVSSICKGINRFVPDINMTILGNRIGY
jgi:general secretion pathway protein G